MCVCTNPGSTAHPCASIASVTVSSISPPISAIRPSRISTSPRSMESFSSIVSIVPPLMRVDLVIDCLPGGLCEDWGRSVKHLLLAETVTPVLRMSFVVFDGENLNVIRKYAVVDGERKPHY